MAMEVARAKATEARKVAYKIKLAAWNLQEAAKKAKRSAAKKIAKRVLKAAAKARLVTEEERDAAKRARQIARAASSKTEKAAWKL